MALTKKQKKHLLPNQNVLIFLTFLVFAVYFNSLANGFVADDVPAIVNNNNLGDFGQVLTTPLQCIRPFLFWLAFKIGGLNPLPFRLINIVFHLGTVWLVYALVSLISKRTLAFFAAAIFAVHPVLVESVTWISGGIHAQYSFFLLLSFFCYILFLSSKKQNLLVFSLASFMLALISSEKAIVLPFLLLLFVISFKNLSQNWKGLAVFWLIGLVFGLMYLGGLGQRVSALKTQFYHQPQTTNPLIQIPISITSYLELIFWPKNLTLYHSEMFFSQAEYLFRAGIFVLFLTGIVYFFRKERQVFFWLSFFLISLLPMLTPFGIAWIVAERYVYLASIGIFVLVGLGLEKLREKENLRQLATIIFCLIIVSLSIRTIIRNNDWKNQDILWLATAKTSPSSPQNHNNLGDLYGRAGDLERAVSEFKKAIELKPGYADAFHNLANTYQQMGKIDLAIENYQKAIEFNPLLWQSHQNLAGIYFEQEKFELAREYMEKAILASPNDANLYYNLGIVYLKLDQKQKAQAAFQKALELDPENPLFQ